MSSAKAKPRCAVCPGQPAFDSMDEYTDHIVDEHDAFTKASMNHLANQEEVYPDA